MKVDIEAVKSCAQEAKIESDKVDELLMALQQRKVEEDAEKEKKPVVKKEFVCLVSDPEGKLKDLEEHVAWVVQITEEDDPDFILSKVNEAAADYNVTKKGRKNPVKSVGEAFEAVGAKHFTSREVWVKTKMPVRIVSTDNQLQKPVSEDY